MNSFIPFFCCVAVAITSASVIPDTPTGSAGIAHGALLSIPVVPIHTNNLYLVSSLRSPDNTWDHGDKEDQWIHADIEQEKEQKDWIQEEGRLNEEERRLDSDKNNEQWNEYWTEGVHSITKRQVNIKNGPEGRWNKELERYEYFNDNGNNGQLNNDGNNLSGQFTSPLGVPSWGLGF